MALRSRIREGLVTMQLPCGYHLHAIFGGKIPARSDIENLLLYNIFDAGCKHLLVRGVTFEWDPRGRCGYEYRYHSRPKSDEFDFWTPGRTSAQIENVSLTDHKLPKVWWAVRQAPVRRPDIELSDQRYCVRVQLQYNRLTAEVIKGILDGLVCAFQVHLYAPDAPRRIASSLGVDEGLIRRNLQDRERASLGAASAPVRCFKNGVQWHPDDTRLVAAALCASPRGPLTRSLLLFMRRSRFSNKIPAKR
jgi:hypothetical protein